MGEANKGKDKPKTEKERPNDTSRLVAPDPSGEPEEKRIRTPSQAEGPRGLVEQDLREKSGQGQPGAKGGKHQVDTEEETQKGMNLVRTPSQAEGNRETVDEDLEEKED